MIYATSAPPYGLRFRDMSSGEEGFLPLPSAPDETLKVQAGGWAWSPDGSSVALSVAYGDSCEDRETLSFAVVRIDNVQRPVLEPLVEDSAKLLRLERWVAPNHILVRDWNGESWWIDSRQGVPVAAPPP
jgi:hypothetical protein